MSGQSGQACERCGRDDGTHEWREGDCILRHKQHSTRLVEGTHVCEHCVDRHRDSLKEIVELYASLDQVVLSSDFVVEQVTYQKPRKAPASPSPLRLAAWAMLHPEQLNGQVRNERTGELENVSLGAHLPDVPDVLTNWAGALYDDKGWTGAPDTVSGAVASLEANAEHMAALPDVDEYDAEIRWVLRSLRSAHGISAPQPYGNCMSVDCNGQVWPGKTQHDEARCNRCPRRYGRLDLVRLKLTEEAQAS